MDYTQKIARQVASVPRSGIRDFFELVQGREGIISLGVGEPDFVTPWNIREAAIYSLEKGQTSYTSNLGLPSLRKSISGYVQDFFGVSYDVSEVLVTVGVSEAIDLALRALLNPGDEVIFHEPCYVSYSPSIVMAYGEAVAVETRKRDGFSLKPEALAAAITPKSRVLMLNFPTNPTGATATREDLEGIAKLCIEHDLMVLTDEIYSELRYDLSEPHVSIASLPGMRERTVLLHGFSKAFAMTGFRLGYACAPQPVVEAMMKIHQYSMLCAPITSQVAALEALENGLPAVAEMRESYRLRRDFLVKRLNEMGLSCHSPGGAFYVFPDIRETGLSSKEFAMRLLEEEGVAAVPGSAFGASGEGFLRCCYATAFEDLQVAMDKMQAFVGRL
ncbi:aminotransferase [Haloferula luteola]|uniref:Aminotransferase n=1 Tax=Haloferula luteola TaxID=595692 RepID=A0A840V0D5_9BACT|nr:aminotransferase class I/II-fold pyridoxal phosphate-dependent enzyme [Haloferula luteola]MBB5350526.1 aminotransferase [Haloferula luteola]